MILISYQNNLDAAVLRIIINCTKQFHFVDFRPFKIVKNKYQLSDIIATRFSLITTLTPPQILLVKIARIRLYFHSRTNFTTKQQRIHCKNFLYYRNAEATGWSF